MSTGQNIKEARKKNGLTQKQLAEKCNMYESQIRKYENGKANPKIETLKRIADALSVTVSSLLTVSGSVTVSLVENFDSELEREFQKKIFHNYKKLSSKGRDKLAEYAEDLSKIPEYRADTSTPSDQDE